LCRSSPAKAQHPCRQPCLNFLSTESRITLAIFIKMLYIQSCSSAFQIDQREKPKRKIAYTVGREYFLNGPSLGACRIPATPVAKRSGTGHYGMAQFVGYVELYRDAGAALADAQMWALTDSSVYLQKSIAILNGWATTNTEIAGSNNKLGGATACIQFCNAAELIKHTGRAWPGAEQEIFAKWLRTVMWPLLRDYIPAYKGNWDALIGHAEHRSHSSRSRIPTCRLWPVQGFQHTVLLSVGQSLILYTKPNLSRMTS